MKKAFTMIELVFVIVVAAILAVAIMPRMSDDSLRQAADQILMHIRYTQHLAMVNDKYDPTDETWYKGYWQIYFNTYDGDQTYTVFSDKDGTKGKTGNPEITEVAPNPLKPHLILTYGNSGMSKEINKKRSPELNLSQKFGIKKNENGVSFNDCKLKGQNGKTAKRLAFDELGRPYLGNLSTASYDDLEDRRLNEVCKIKITNDNNENICILVQPETGYSCIDEDCDGTCDR